ncbi:Rieske (2Fe-2S) protein [Modestobacter sp. L9-4]|uniref:Rieske (2Fe-2S) protein n=1 Tax=Modestobacter sp. L9-4 TaxID=2851567 RepID=UPI001C75890B|nr:Rieske (2Fe-2S) protein [Modestobacter sp. L9-4]QXG74688.1 Rieske (2Fe-2S) protein [Modestobacter sp. L9-4]
MPKTHRVPATELPPGAVRPAGPWAVANADGRLAAVSRRCRHQLADLSAGSVDADGCLVCPWHQARYDLHTGEMVSGSRGFLGYHGPTPGYSGLVKRLGQVVRLRVRRARREGPDVVVG